MAKWIFKKESGRAKKKFVELSKVWEAAGEKEGYYIGLSSEEVCMDPPEVSKMARALSTCVMDLGAEHFMASSAKTRKSKEPFLSGKTLEEQIAALTKDLQSDWYADDAILEGTIRPNNRVFIEAESDGTEFGVYLFGPNAERLSNDLQIQMIQHLDQ